jgi:nicotinate-nucleotide pyrophosphorylase (carboxylating)
MTLNRIIIDDVVKRALLEDLGHGYDATTQAMPLSKTGHALFKTREDGVLCGMELAEAAFQLLDPSSKFEQLKKDGDYINKGETLATITCQADTLLTGERTALNFMTLLSGVASATYDMVQIVKDTGTKIVCTRKTLPGLRILQKYAVKTGGGFNHRFGLGDAILIKDNHIALAGGIKEAITHAKEFAGHMQKIEVEVDTLDQLKIVLDYEIDAVLLDNMRGKTLEEAVKLVDGQAITEASGGIDKETIREVALTGVDLISSGAITHSFKSLDIGLDIEL